MDDCYLVTLIFENHDNYKDNDRGKLEELEKYLSSPEKLSQLLDNKKYLKYKPIANTKNKKLSFKPIFK